MPNNRVGKPSSFSRVLALASLLYALPPAPAALDFILHRSVLYTYRLFSFTFKLLFANVTPFSLHSEQYLLSHGRPVLEIGHSRPAVAFKKAHPAAR